MSYNWTGHNVRTTEPLGAVEDGKSEAVIIPAGTLCRVVSINERHQGCFDLSPIDETHSTTYKGWITAPFVSAAQFEDVEPFPYVDLTNEDPKHDFRITHALGVGYKPYCSNCGVLESYGWQQNIVIAVDSGEFHQRHPSATHPGVQGGEAVSWERVTAYDHVINKRYTVYWRFVTAEGWLSVKRVRPVPQQWYTWQCFRRCDPATVPFASGGAVSWQTARAQAERAYRSFCQLTPPITEDDVAKEREARAAGGSWLARTFAHDRKYDYVGTASPRDETEHYCSALYRERVT